MVLLLNTKNIVLLKNLRYWTHGKITLIYCDLSRN